MAPQAAGDIVEVVTKGYAFTGPALEFGCLLVDGEPSVGAQVRVPLGNLETVMTELMVGNWSAVAGQLGLIKN